MIRDGDGEKGSTNGTWLYAEEEVKIEPGSMIKAGASIFKINMAQWDKYKEQYIFNLSYNSTLNWVTDLTIWFHITHNLTVMNFA